MKIREVMSSPAYTCLPQDTLENAAGKLWEHDCGMLVVVDAKGAVGGALTDRDICMGALTKGRPLGELRVADSMSDGIVTCSADEDVSAAALRMADRQLHRLPVVDADGKAIGMLSLNDLANVSQEHAPVGKHALAVLTAICRHRTSVPIAPEKPNRKAPLTARS
ncbi:MAG: CBS domain-containing protein [Planctomycetes bacterium]|nr:CBS domain-containing protein [Planctomycetota bacterium]